MASSRDALIRALGRSLCYLVHVTREEQARLDSLLARVRADRSHVESDTTIVALARQFQLDPMVVRRVLEDEGLVEPRPTEVDPEVESQATGVFDLDEFRQD